MSVQRKLLCLALILVSLALLYPGVTQPVLTLTGTVEKSRIAELGIEMIAGEGADDQTRQMLTAISSFLGFDRIEGQLEAYRNTRSIWGTVDELARSGFGLGTRSQRFAMIVDDGKVAHLNVEEGPGVDVSAAETMMALL